MKGIGILFVCLLSLLLFTTPASADFIFDLTAPNTALQPYAGPYAQIDVKWIDPTHAQITETAIGNYKIVDGGALDLNIKGAYTLDATNPISYTGYATAGYVTQAGAQNIDGWGTFSLVLDAKSSDHPLDSVTVNIVATGGNSWATVNDVLTLNDKNQLAAGHISASGVTGFASVPIPPAVMLLGSGLVGLVAIRRRFKKWRN